ncbi:hypothetical protein EIP86_005349 [Pleurotus ostreatoroseus]|nr:hypothetical protein EIP86_005349 [Pleurotus ostreatoroseus]
MSAMAEPTRAHSNHQIVGSSSNTPIIVLENGSGARSPDGLAEPDKFYIRTVASAKTDAGSVTKKGDECAFAGLSASTKQAMLACDKKTPVALNPLYSPTLVLSFCDPSMLPPPPPSYSAATAAPIQCRRFSVLARASRWSIARRRS